MQNFSQQLRNQKNAVKNAQKQFSQSEQFKTASLIEPEKKVNLKLSNHTQGYWPSSKNVRQ